MDPQKKRTRQKSTSSDDGQNFEDLKREFPAALLFYKSGPNPKSSANLATAKAPDSRIDRSSHADGPPLVSSETRDVLRKLGLC